MFNNRLNPLPAQNQTALQSKRQLLMEGLDLWGWDQIYCNTKLASTWAHILALFRTDCVSIFLTVSSYLISCLLIYGMAWVSAASSLESLWFYILGSSAVFTGAPLQGGWIANTHVLCSMWALHSHCMARGNIVISFSSYAPSTLDCPCFCASLEPFVTSCWSSPSLPPPEKTKKGMQSFLTVKTLRLSGICVIKKRGREGEK